MLPSVEVEPVAHLYTPPGAKQPLTIWLHPTLLTSLDRLDDWGFYLICASGKIADHAQHYSGIAERSILERISQHLLGTSKARLPAVYLEAGYTLRIARIWWHKQAFFERAFKLRADAPSYCPFCNPATCWNYQVHPRHDQLLNYERYRHLWPKIRAAQAKDGSPTEDFDC